MSVPGGSREQHPGASEGSVGEIIPEEQEGPDGERLEGFGLSPLGQQGGDTTIIFEQ